MPHRSQTQAKKLSDDEYARLAAFRYALRQFLRFSEAAAEKAGLSAQQYQALLALRGSQYPEHATIADLAKQLLIRHNSAVGLVDRLVEQGMLVRRPSAQDARKVNLHLTAKGSRVLEDLAGSHRAELEHVGSELGRLLLQIADATAVKGKPPRARTA